MTELLQDLAFACCRCDETTSFTVHCAGRGLDAGPRITVSAAVPCYCCGAVHEVRFHPGGEVVGADLKQGPMLMPVPSRN